MITALRKKVIVSSDGRIEFKITDLEPGTQAEVIVLLEESKSDRQKRVKRLKSLFKASQALPQAKTISEKEIAEEIAVYRTGK